MTDDSPVEAEAIVGVVPVMPNGRIAIPPEYEQNATIRTKSVTEVRYKKAHTRHQGVENEWLETDFGLLVQFEKHGEEGRKVYRVLPPGAVEDADEDEAYVRFETPYVDAGQDNDWHDTRVE